MFSSSRVPRSSYPLSGEVDIAVVESIEREIAAAAHDGGGPDVEIDCGDLTFIDASGVTMLMNVETRSGKRVRLTNVAPPCRRVFEVLDLCERFHVEVPLPLHLVPPRSA